VNAVKEQTFLQLTPVGVSSWYEVSGRSGLNAMAWTS
jgi:hypothetical protein